MSCNRNGGHESIVILSDAKDLWIVPRIAAVLRAHIINPCYWTRTIRALINA
jgi:hypothetical protein